MTSRRQDILDDAIKLGFYMDWHNPGGVTTRYRFFRGKKRRDYFEGKGVYTAFGMNEAEAFLEGIRVGKGR